METKKKHKIRENFIKELFIKINNIFLNIFLNEKRKNLTNSRKN